MREQLITATESAIRAIDASRFFKTERGFHGRFYCALQTELDRFGLIADGAILEMEYQKSARHGLIQRPDIIFHVPTEHSGFGVVANNFAVWALKRHATNFEAIEDFNKLDQMFDTLRYPLGFFINIDSTQPMLEHYTGQHRDRLVALAACIDGSAVKIHRVPLGYEAYPSAQLDPPSAPPSTPSLKRPRS